MRVWKPLSKYRYSKERDEYKYHTDFALEEGDDIIVYNNGEKLLSEYIPKGEERKYHFEMAVERFAEKPEETYNGVSVSKLKVGGTD